MDPTPRFAIPASVVHRQVDQQMVLLDLATENYFGLDEVGTRIVSRITTQPFEHALDALVRDFDVDRDVLVRDIGDLVDELVANGLLAPPGEAG